MQRKIMNNSKNYEVYNLNYVPYKGKAFDTINESETELLIHSLPKPITVNQRGFK